MRFRTIDGLRGIAAMAVVVFHMNEATSVTFGHWLPSVVDSLFRSGHYGVDIFFVISGFVIAYSIRTADPTIAFIGRFALRRSIRLDPPYWTAIFLEIAVQTLALHLAFSVVPLPSPPQVLAHFFYLQNILELGNIVDIFWTLCFEIQFYLALISLLVLRRKLDETIGRETAEWLSIAALSLLFIYSVSIRFQLFGMSGHPGIATLRWYQFFMGSCVWWVVSGRVTWLVLPVLWGVLLATVVSVDASVLETLPIFVSGLIWWSYRKDQMATALSNRPVQWLGAISYSLYVFHATVGWRFIRLIGEIVGKDSPGFVPYVAFLMSIAVCVGVAWLGWRVLETPSMNWSKKIALPRATS